MEYKKESTIICLGDPKQAALYYDRVVPVSFAFSRSEQSPEKYVYDLANLLGLNFTYDKETCLSIDKKISEMFKLIIFIMDAHTVCRKTQEPIFGYIATQSDRIKEYIISKDSEAEVNGAESPDIDDLLLLLGLSYVEDLNLSKRNTSYGSISVRLIIDNFSSFLGIRQAPVLLPSECLNYIKATEDDLSFSIANFPLVDTKKAQWDQIFEFRKDKAARKKLRNLLLFFHINYEDKSFAFIEDDLNKRLDEYHIAIKDWGFETRNSIFSALMDSQSLLATYAAILGAILLKEPIAQTFSALAGATLNIGKIILTYDKQKHAFHKLKTDHDLAYIIEAKEHFENTS